MFFYNIKKLKKLIIRILKSLENEIHEKKVSQEQRYNELINTYKSADLNYERKQLLNKLNVCLSELNFPLYNENIGMYSEHLLLFTAISNLSKKTYRILEIGTYDGRTSCILTKLFPDSEITTIDLKDNDPIFKETYNRSKNLKSFINNRNSLIKSYPNIHFIQGNSLELTFSENLYNQDLIWIDGAHGYPVVTSDITNCLRLLNKDGILLCDDVWKDLKKVDKVYKSIATFETLNAFAKSGFVTNKFFKKRIGKRFNNMNKYISLTKVNKNKSNKNNLN